MQAAERMRRLLGRRRAGQPRGRGDRASRIGTPAIDVHGPAPNGAAAEVTMAGAWVVVLFLTSSCYGCRVLWDGMARQSPKTSPARGMPPVVVVTPSPSTESARTVAGLAPEGLTVVMSSDAWHAYGVTRAPWCVVVAGGVVVADGPAPPTWDGVETLAPDPR